MKTKAQFLADPKRAKLSTKEKNKRWAQYQQSLIHVQANVNRGRTPNTKLKVTSQGVAELHLSHCARLYLSALMFGFSNKEVACIPDLHSVPSRKLRVKTRGTFSTGTTGFGWLVVSPWCNANNNVTHGGTTATYNLASGSPILTPAVLTPNLFQGYESRLPYPGADFQDLIAGGVQARTVGVGLRIRYIGSEMSRSGQIVAIRDIDNETLVGKTAADLRAQSTAKTFQNSREWHHAMYRPVKPAEYEYSPYACVDAEGPSTLFKYPMGFFIEGTTNTTGSVGAAPFEYEIIRYVEYIGTIASMTKSHVDLVGMSDIRNSLPEKSVYSDTRSAKLRMAHDLVTTISDRTGLRQAEIQPTLNVLTK